MNWRTAWRRLQHWTTAGIWGRVVAELCAMAPDAGWEEHLLDTSVIRAHAHAAGARKAVGDQAIGVDRGRRALFPVGRGPPGVQSANAAAPALTAR
jgi:transposase